MTAAEPKKILLVEDQTEAAEALSLLLEMEGYAVSTARDGYEGLECLEDDPQTSLIILDLRMPNMDGRTFLHHIRHQDSRFQAIPVIVVSAWAASLPEQVEAAITKPVDFERLLAAIERALSKPEA